MEQREAIVKVDEVMTTKLVSMDEDDPIIEAARKMAENDMSSILVRHRGELAGIVTDRDIILKVVAKGLDPKKTKTGQIMSTPLITIQADASIEEAAKKMRDRKVRRLVVQDKNKTTGIITESDIVRFDPELHLLIREYSSLATQLTPQEPRETTITGVCEDCGNFSTNLMKIRGRWLCEECREE